MIGRWVGVPTFHDPRRVLGLPGRCSGSSGSATSRPTTRRSPTPNASLIFSEPPIRPAGRQARQPHFNVGHAVRLPQHVAGDGPVRLLELHVLLRHLLVVSLPEEGLRADGRQAGAVCGGSVALRGRGKLGRRGHGRSDLSQRTLATFAAAAGHRRFRAGRRRAWSARNSSTRPSATPCFSRSPSSAPT